jgi:hypothetical protein
MVPFVFDYIHIYLDNLKILKMSFSSPIMYTVNMLIIYLGRLKSRIPALNDL